MAISTDGVKIKIPLHFATYIKSVEDMKFHGR